MLNRPIFYTQYIVIDLPTGVGTMVEFDEQPRLENAYILGIEAYTSANLAREPEGRILVPVAESTQPLVTLKVNSEERIEAVPYSSFVATFNAGAVNQYCGQTFNWPKSFVTNPPGTVYADPCVLYFLVHYIPVDQLGQFSEAELRSFMF